MLIQDTGCRKDYYDYVQKHGQDRSCVYLRHEHSEYVEAPIRDIPIGLHPDGLGVTHLRLIGFCGTLYPYLVFERHKRADLHSFSVEATLEVCKSSKAKQVERLYDTSDMPDLFRSEPLFVLYPDIWDYEQKKRRPKVVYNCLLRPTGFSEIKTPEQAFQDIYRWLMNRQSPARPIPIIPNDMRIVTHGFNKESFRKGKSK